MVRLGFGREGGADECPLLSGHTDGYCNTLCAAWKLETSSSVF